MGGGVSPNKPKASECKGARLGERLTGSGMFQAKEGQGSLGVWLCLPSPGPVGYFSSQYLLRDQHSHLHLLSEVPHRVRRDLKPGFPSHPTQELVSLPGE